MEREAAAGIRNSPTIVNDVLSKWRITRCVRQGL